MMNRSAPYAEKPLFKVPKEEKYDTDVVMIADEMVNQARKNFDDIIDDSIENGMLH